MLFDYPTYAFVVLAALGAIAAYGIIASRRSYGKSAAEYFLGSRSLSAFSVGSSLFVTNILGLWLLGEGGNREIGLILLYGVLAIIFVLVLGFYFAPIYCRSRVVTVPEFLSLRFNNTTGMLLSGLSILFSVGVKIPLLLLFASWVLHNVLGYHLMTSAILIVVVVSIGLYTIMGGLLSVVRTHVLEAGIVITGVVLTGVWMLVNPLHHTEATGSPLSPEIPFPMLLGLTIVFAWQWWADQYTVQRILAARNIESARKGTLIGAGLIAVVLLLLLVSAKATGVSPVTYLFYDGTVLREIGSIVFLALLMATLANDFHSTATLFTTDFFKGVYADASDESMVLVGRLATTLVVVLAILQVSTMSLVDGQILALLQQVQVHVAPPMLVVLMFGIFWQRMNSAGALWALIIGELLGACDLLIRFLIGISAISAGGLYEWGSMNTFSFGIISAGVSIGVLVMATLATHAPGEELNAYMTLLRRRQQ